MKDDEFLNRIKVDPGSPDFQEQLLLQREFNEKNKLQKQRANQAGAFDSEALELMLEAHGII